MTWSGRWVVLVLGVATFLVAAKTHGRQLRLERELAGYWHVTFGAQNPAFVEALWRRERILYWSVAATLALAAIIFRVLAPRFAWPLPVQGPSGERSWIGTGFLHMLVPLVGAFLVTGLLSVGRFVFSARGGTAVSAERPAHWFSTATWGTAPARHRYPAEARRREGRAPGAAGDRVGACQRQALSGRLGVETEAIPHWLKLRAGTYLEPARVSNGTDRVHGTFGFDLKTFSWDVFGLIGDFDSWVASAALDYARNYLSTSFSIGFWH